jgi:uncharacterized peroxidase-related enzyme
MTYIGTVPDDEATGQVAEQYEADRERLGYVANYTRAFSHRPVVYAAWVQLNTSIKAGMDLRRYELATLAAARRLGSSYCCLAHGKVLRDQFLEPSALLEIVRDHRSADLDPGDVAVMDLAAKVAEDATAVTSDDIDRLRAFGLTDGDVLSVILAAAARSFFSKVLDATGTQADAAYRALEPELQEALVVGRPIEGSIRAS